MGGGTAVGFRKRISKRIPGSFLLRRSLSFASASGSTQEVKRKIGCSEPETAAEEHERRPFGREDSDNSRFSSASNNSISSVSVSSSTSNPRGQTNTSPRTKSATNWFFSEAFCQPVYRLPKNSELSLDQRGIPQSTANTLVIRLWTITVKGFVYQKMNDFEKEWIRKLPEAAQATITNLYKNITIFDYENAEFNVETNTSHLPVVDDGTFAQDHSQKLPTLSESTSITGGSLSTTGRNVVSGEEKSNIAQAESSPLSKNTGVKENKEVAIRSPSMSPRGGMLRQSPGTERRALFAEKRSLSGRLSFPSSKMSKKSSGKQNVLETANTALKEYGISAALCKHESHYIGGSIVLTYYIRFESDGSSRKVFALSSLKHTLSQEVE